jgi:hypothetical protein
VVFLHKLQDEFRVASDVPFLEWDAARRKKLFRHKARRSTGLGIEKDLVHTHLNSFIRKGIDRVKPGSTVGGIERPSYRADDCQCNCP